MFRTAILIITIALLIMFVNSWLKLRAQKPPAKKTRPGKLEHESMVRCDQCGLHVPNSRAIKADGHNYCSRKHQRVHAKSLQNE